jgi:hypothetical protein
MAFALSQAAPAARLRAAAPCAAARRARAAPCVAAASRSSAFAGVALLPARARRVRRRSRRPPPSPRRLLTRRACPQAATVRRGAAPRAESQFDTEEVIKTLQEKARAPRPPPAVGARA